MIAGAADKIVEAGALAAKDDDEIAGEVELVIVRLATFIETNDPEILLLEIFKSANEVDNAGDAEVLGGAGTGLYGYSAEGCGAALSDDDTVDSGSIGNAEKRAKVLRIFDTIEGEDETGAAVVGGIGLVEIFNGEEFLRTDEGDHALVRGSFGGER
jgi:hypothetical protein